MATDKPLRRHPTIDGALQEVETIDASVGAGSSGGIISANDQGQVDITFLPPGAAGGTFVRTASEGLSAGDFLNIWNDAGVEKVRKADRTNGRVAHCFTDAGVALGAAATCYPPGESNVSLAGLTIGAVYVLGTVGAIEPASTATIASGDLEQVVGSASADDTLLFIPQTAIEVA